MRKIKMTFDKLNALSEEINELSNDFHMRYIEIDSILESIESSHTWIGKDELSYYRLLKEKYMVALKEINNVLDEYSTFLGNAGRAKEGLENDMALKNISIY